MDIKPAYEHTKFGNFMFNLCAKGTRFILKHQGLYYICGAVFGSIMTIAGLVVTLALAIAKIFVPTIIFSKYYGIYSIKVGPEYGGGMDMGLMFCRDYKSKGTLNEHEFGHTFQYTMPIVGGFSLFLVTIPSAARYWYDVIKGLKNPYDSFGAEDAATQCGIYAVNYLETKNK